MKKTLMKHFLLAFFCVVTAVVNAQNPWVGGLNACQFGRMDLDGDAQKDLLVFDRHGNRLLCFINKGVPGAIDYQYTTAYDEAFPKLSDWVVFADYDGDGREDIFTYSKGWAGIKVYRNVSTDENIEFQLVKYPFLTSLQGGGEINILATDADYPAIFDMDGDGDLDVLTFGVMGNFLEKHLNLSMEHYGCLDSLVFERTELCWGYVAESEEDNVMYLDTCLFGYGLVVDADAARHRGATVAVRDLTGDGLLDLLLADVDYPGLTLLVNGGDDANALMIGQMDFPPNDPVNLYAMPVPFFTDINNDGVDDLLVSPFDPDPMACEGMESVWLYLNHGSNTHPDFQLYSKSFLQDRMIDVGKGAYPVFTDWDGDGLMDLTVRDFDGQTTLFKNVGTAQQPAFEQIAVDAPSDGSASCYYDVDQDGLMDRVDGRLDGKLTYYKGTVGGFEWVTDFWGEVDVRDYSTSYHGYSVPTLFEYHGRLLLCVGSEQGRLFLFQVSDDAVFEEVEYLWEEICPELPERFGMHSAAAIADLDGDGLLEVVVGNFGGGLQLFNADIPVVNLGVSEQEDEMEVLIFPNPVESLLHVIAPRNDVLVMDLFGNVIIEKQPTAPETIIDVSGLAPGVYLIHLGLVNRIFIKR